MARVPLKFWSCVRLKKLMILKIYKSRYLTMMLLFLVCYLFTLIVFKKKYKKGF